MTEAKVNAPEPGALGNSVREFVAWLGNGRKLTQTGRLTMTDARILVDHLKTGDTVDPVIGDRKFRTPSSRELFRLNLLFTWAKAARFVRIAGGRVVPVAKNAKVLQSAEESFAALLEALPRLGEVIAPPNGWLWSPVSLEFPAVVGLVLGELTASTAPMPPSVICAEVWTYLDQTFIIDDADQQIAAVRSCSDRDVRRILDALTWAGAVAEVNVAAKAEGEAEAEAEAETRVALTASARTVLAAPGTAPRCADEPMLELLITLRGSAEPAVWRRILIPARYPLPLVHTAIQNAMGWTDSHLHQFTIKRVRYRDHSWGEPDDGSTDERDVLLGDLVRQRSRFEYEYDFGDSWEHDVVVEKRRLATADEGIPACLAGEGACPPEDCGGIYGYLDGLLPALADPKHPQQESYREWLGLEEGTTLDPHTFDVAAADRRMRRTRSR